MLLLLWYCVRKKGFWCCVRSRYKSFTLYLSTVGQSGSKLLTNFQKTSHALFSRLNLSFQAKRSTTTFTFSKSKLASWESVLSNKIFFGSTFAIYIKSRNVSSHAIFSPLISFIQQKFLTVQEVSSKPAAQWFSLTCLLQHFPSNERCVLLSWCGNICVQNAGRKSTFGEMKNFHSKVKKNTYTKHVTVLWHLQMTSV